MAYRSRERVARILAHQEADRVPLDAGIFRSLPIQEWCDELGFGEDERECFSKGDFRYLTFNLDADRGRFSPYLPGLPAEAEVTPFGVGEVPRMHAMQGDGTLPPRARRRHRRPALP